MWESAAAPPRAHVSPRRAARAASSPASPLAHGRLLTISDHDTTIPAQKQAIPAPSQRPPFRAACQPVKRRRWIYSRSVGNGRQRGHVRQRAARWVFPRLPGRARHPGQLRGLCLAQVAELAPMLQAPLDGLPYSATPRRLKSGLVVYMVQHPLEKITAQFVADTPQTAKNGLFATLSSRFGHCIQPSNLPLTFKLLQKPA